jgi:hypothetical protein
MLTLAEPGDPTPTWVEWKFRAHGESLQMARNGVDSGLSVTAHCICLVGRACSSVMPEWLRYGGAVDVKRAADLYAHGRTLSQIGGELGVHLTTVIEQLRVRVSPCVAAWVKCLVDQRRSQVIHGLGERCGALAFLW